MSQNLRLYCFFYILGHESYPANAINKLWVTTSHMLPYKYGGNS